MAEMDIMIVNSYLVDVIEPCTIRPYSLFGISILNSIYMKGVPYTIGS